MPIPDVTLLSARCKLRLIFGDCFSDREPHALVHYGFSP